MTTPTVCGPLPSPPGSNLSATWAPLGRVSAMSSHPNLSNSEAANRFAERSVSAGCPCRRVGSDRGGGWFTFAVDTGPSGPPYHSDAPADALPIAEMADDEVLEELEVERRHLPLGNGRL